MKRKSLCLEVRKAITHVNKEIDKHYFDGITSNELRDVIIGVCKDLAGHEKNEVVKYYFGNESVNA